MIGLWVRPILDLLHDLLDFVGRTEEKEQAFRLSSGVHFSSYTLRCSSGFIGRNEPWSLRNTIRISPNETSRSGFPSPLTSRKSRVTGVCSSAARIGPA